MTVIKHEGVKRRSGRYPWGSGKDPYQRSKSFLGMVKELEKEGMSEVDIAKSLDMSIIKLRARKSIAKDEIKKNDLSLARKLKDKGYSLAAISERMGVSDHTVKAMLDPSYEVKADETRTIADILKRSVDEKKYIDVGAGVERHLGVTRTKMDTAVALLEEEGYLVQYTKIPQPGTGKNTSIKSLTRPEISSKELYANRYEIKMPIEYHTEDGGKTWQVLEKPVSIDSKRIKIKYKETGGEERDGIIELRRGVEDISLGESKYSQVRIAVDNKYFMKGMAIYSDNIPDGFDIVYNSKKPLGTRNDKVFKPMEEEEVTPNNPFGSAIRQKKYIGSDGKEHLSALNIINEEGDWTDWSRTISSQILSKQLPQTAKKQLDLAFDRKKEEYDEIMSIANPAVRKQLLAKFSDDCDAAAVHLKAAALPRQANVVLLPFNSIKPNEVYAPGFIDGEAVVLIRHPHGGKFEIPELIVNNRNREAKAIIQNAEDAIGIHYTTAKRLSGADFDGDAVLIIPNKDGYIKSERTIESLKDFDTSIYANSKLGTKKLTEQRKQLLMGEVSNLITDMTIKGANLDEISRAVKHSMVVIDAVKHELDYKQSELDHNIAGLKSKYQGSPRGGASTLISRAKSEQHVPLRKEQYSIDPVTGNKVYKYITGETYINRYGKKTKATVPSIKEALNFPGETYKKYVPAKKGVPIEVITDPVTGKKTYLNSKEKIIRRTTKTTKMEYTDDAFTLSSGTRIENIYASYANSLKDLANKSRLTIMRTSNIPYSQSANKVYAKEVQSLMSKLNIAIRHKPLERQALMLADKNIDIKKAKDPNMSPATLKKIKGLSLEDARRRNGGSKHRIKEISEKEWEAIQAGAISNNVLSRILLNADLKAIQQRALPRTFVGMSPSEIIRAKSMLATGHTQAEVANALGVSPNTLSKSLD